MKQKESIPVTRWIFYILVMALTPLLFLIYMHFQQQKQIDQMQSTLFSLQLNATKKREQQSSNKFIRHHFANADHFYIDHLLEPLSLLHSERTALQRVLTAENFPGDHALEERYAFITGAKNHLSFKEGIIQKGEGFQETLEALKHPVEVDGEDLKRVLQLIEKPSSSDLPPQMLLTQFSLKRKKTIESAEVFELDLKLLKREFNA